MPLIARLACLACLASLTAACQPAPSTGAPASELAGPPLAEASAWGAGVGTGAWTYRELPDAGADLSLAFSLRIDAASQETLPVHELDRFANYRNQAELGGYEAAAVLRRGPEGEYRFQLSARWQEAVLWSSRGGVLAVRPLPIEAGREYAVRAVARGAYLALYIDGQLLLERWDHTAPLLSGGAALGRKEGQSSFTAAILQPLTAQAEGPPTHAPRFALREWKGLRWGFDGDEPIFVLGMPVEYAASFPRSSTTAFEVKLVPGYAAQAYLPLYLQGYDEPFALDVLRGVTVQGEGEQLAFQLDTEDSAASLRGTTRVQLSYAAALNVYRYDIEASLTVPAGRTLRTDQPLDVTDVGFLGVVPSASTQGAQWPVSHSGSVYLQQDNQLFQQPLNHVGWYPGYGQLAYWIDKLAFLRPDGGFWAMTGDPIANPVIQLDESPDRKQFDAGLCGVGFDLHLRWNPPYEAGARSVVLQPGTYRVRWRLTSAPAQTAGAWASLARYANGARLSSTWLLYTGGVGHTERFDKVVPQASSFGEYPWGPGALRDATVGHGDRSSLRLDGAVNAGSEAGDQRFTEPVLGGTDYEVSAWVRTEGVVGEGPGLVLGGVPYYPGLSGTTDWRRIGVVVHIDEDQPVLPFTLHNSGGGTAWFDDFLIRPLPSGAAPDAGIARAPRPLSSVGAPRADLGLLWTPASDVQDRGGTILDLSGHGHHGLLGGARYVDDGGGRAIQLGGGAQAVMRGHPSTDLGEVATLSFWVRPGALDTLAIIAAGGPQDLYDEWQLIASGGEGAPYPLVLRALGQYVSTGPLLQQDRWHHLAISHDGSTLRLYVDGAVIREVSAAGRLLRAGGDAALRFGAGAQERELVYPFAGRLGAVRVAPRALSPAEVAAQVLGGPYQ